MHLKCLIEAVLCFLANWKCASFHMADCKGKNFVAPGPVELGERENLEKRTFRQASLNEKDAGCYYCKLDGHSPKQKRPRLKGMQRATCMAACRHFEACLTIFSLFVFLKTGRSKFLVDTVFLNSGKASQPPFFRQSMQEWQVLPKKKAASWMKL